MTESRCSRSETILCLIRIYFSLVPTFSVFPDNLPVDLEEWFIVVSIIWSQVIFENDKPEIEAVNLHF